MQAGDATNGLKGGNGPLPQKRILSICYAPIAVTLSGLFSVFRQLLTLFGLDFTSCLGGHRRGLCRDLTILR